jgi:hypothetical protein
MADPSGYVETLLGLTSPIVLVPSDHAIINPPIKPRPLVFPNFPLNSLFPSALTLRDSEQKKTQHPFEKIDICPDRSTMKGARNVGMSEVPAALSTRDQGHFLLENNCLTTGGQDAVTMQGTRWKCSRARRSVQMRSGYELGSKAT